MLFPNPLLVGSTTFDAKYKLPVKKILLTLFLLASISSFAQTSLHRRAEKSYTRLEFATAANLYERILKKCPADQVAKARLAQCYKFLKTRNDWRNQSGNRQISTGANVPVK
jgi:hypothetical protein